jgi:hypothetical protein
MSKIILPTNKWFTSIFLLSNNSVKTGTKPYWNIPFLWDKILDEINFHNEIFSTSSSFFSLFSEINRKGKNKKKKTKYKFLPSLFFISRTLKILVMEWNCWKNARYSCLSRQEVKKN